jgi:patatin-like phospholipase/acyl hydrolase
MRFQILSLSGGGFLGLYTACVLAEIEAHSKTRIADHFDLIAGTSVGGIIAVGLAARKPAADIRDAFINEGPNIFRTQSPPQTWLGRRWQLRENALGAKYSSEGLRQVIGAVIDGGTRIGDLPRAFMAPTVNLTKGKPQVFKTDHHPTFMRDWKLNATDVALATSAAPTFFPLHRIGGELFADGGLYANAPDQLALHEATYFFEKDISDIAMLSVGTTTSKFSFTNSRNTDLGWLGWLENQRLPRVMISAQQLNDEYILQHRLGDRYLRIDHEQSPEQEQHLALDVASPGAILDLQALAEASVRTHTGRPALSRFLAHAAPASRFFNRDDK